MTKTFRPDLGKELIEMLDDFCDAHHDANATAVVRKAIRQFIESDIAVNDGVRKAYEKARTARLKTLAPRLVSSKPSD